MYFLERGFQWSKSLMSYEEATEEFSKQQHQPGQTELTAPEGVGDSVSNWLYDNCSVYEYNETFLDLRTPSDEKRGLITIFLLWVYGFLFFFFLKFAGTAAEYIISGYGYYEDIPLVVKDYFFLPLFPLFLMAVLGVF